VSFWRYWLRAISTRSTSGASSGAAGASSAGAAPPRARSARPPRAAHGARGPPTPRQGGAVGRGAAPGAGKRGERDRKRGKSSSSLRRRGLVQAVDHHLPSAIARLEEDARLELPPVGREPPGLRNRRPRACVDLGHQPPSVPLRLALDLPVGVLASVGEE